MFNALNKVTPEVQGVSKDDLKEGYKFQNFYIKQGLLEAAPALCWSHRDRFDVHFCLRNVRFCHCFTVLRESRSLSYRFSHRDRSDVYLCLQNVRFDYCLTIVGESRSLSYRFTCVFLLDPRSDARQF